MVYLTTLSSENTASNDKMINESRIRKDVETNGPRPNVR
jgi:hypothetical protein